MHVVANSLVEAEYIQHWAALPMQQNSVWIGFKRSTWCNAHLLYYYRKQPTMSEAPLMNWLGLAVKKVQCWSLTAVLPVNCYSSCEQSYICEAPFSNWQCTISRIYMYVAMIWIHCIAPLWQRFTKLCLSETFYAVNFHVFADWQHWKERAGQNWEKIVSPYASCNDYSIVCSKKTSDDPELVCGGGRSWMLTSAPCVPWPLHLVCLDLCTLCLWCFPFISIQQQILYLAHAWLSLVATYSGGVFSQPLAQILHLRMRLHPFQLAWCFPSTHWCRYCTCTQTTCTVWWWCVIQLYVHILVALLQFTLGQLWFFKVTSGK